MSPARGHRLESGGLRSWSMQRRQGYKRAAFPNITAATDTGFTPVKQESGSRTKLA